MSVDYVDNRLGILNSLDSIEVLEVNGIRYYSSIDISKMIGNPRVYNILKYIEKESKIDSLGKIFVDSLGILSILIRNKSIYSYEVLRYLVDGNIHVDGNIPKINYCEIDRYNSRNNTEFYDKDCLPVTVGYSEIDSGKIIIYKSNKEFPIFNVPNLSKVFSEDPDKTIKKISDRNKKKMIKMDFIYGDKFSWFTNSAGLLEMTIKSRYKESKMKSREMFNLVSDLINNHL